MAEQRKQFVLVNRTKPLPQGLAEQTLATLKWWAYDPARYNGTAVGFKFNVAVRFVIF